MANILHIMVVVPGFQIDFDAPTTFQGAGRHLL
jgi:hypothetical protein